MKISSVKTMQT